MRERSPIPDERDRCENRNSESLDSSAEESVNQEDMSTTSPPIAPIPPTNTAAFAALRESSPSRAEAQDQARPRRALAYMRVSSQRQMGTARDIDEDGNSIATQREFVERKARELGADIVHEFVEPGTSAQTIAKRLVFREMLSYLEEHGDEIDYVIIYARSRAFRNLYDAVLVEHDLAARDIELISATENFGTDEDMAMLLKVLTDGFNHVQVRHNGRDIANKMLHKAQQGGTTGRAKLGYLNVRKSFDGHLVNTIDVDPERAPLIQWAFEMYAGGNYSLVRLRDELEVRGLTTRATRTRSEQPLSLSTLAAILTDPYYTGVVTYKGDIYEGRHPALISVELFQAVEVVMAARRKRGTRERVHHHFLKGALFCARCSGPDALKPLVYLEASGRGGIYPHLRLPSRARLRAAVRALGSARGCTREGGGAGPEHQQAAPRVLPRGAAEDAPR